MNTPQNHLPPQPLQQQEPPPASQQQSRQKTNRGCWIIAALGCGLTLIIIAAIVGFFVMILASEGDWGGSVTENVIYEGGDGKIAVINVSGVITEGSSSGGLLTTDGTSSGTIINEIQKAKNDDLVRGVLIRMNSPGGEVVASDLIYREVRELRAEKPVVTWMSGSGASGGYLIAAGSDAIIAHPSTITGSIGVILEITNLEGLYDKLGIESRVFKTGEFKDMSGVFDGDPEGEADQILQSLVDESYEEFVNAVVDSRGMDPIVVRDLADGRVYTGKQAAANGLVDGTGDIDDAVLELESRVGATDLSIVEYESGGFWSNFYEYEQAFIEKFGLLPSRETVGVTQYYLLDL